MGNSTVTSPPRPSRFPRPVAEDWIFLSLIGWGVLLVIAAAIATGIAWFGTVTGSVWLPASGAAPWFAGFIGGYLMHQVLPMWVANGRTRRDTALGLGMVGAIVAFTLAALATAGFVLERVLYALLDWPLGVIEDHLFDSHSEVALIFVEYLFILLLWTAGGALIGSAFYRDSGLGLGAIVVAIVLAGISGANSGFTVGPMALLSLLFDEPAWTPLAGIVISLACTAAALALTWLVVRDTPIRNR